MILEVSRSIYSYMPILAPRILRSAVGGSPRNMSFFHFLLEKVDSLKYAPIKLKLTRDTRMEYTDCI
jgi:hypothetical protein